MARYAFAAPILPGKTATWKKLVVEMKGKRKAGLAASRKKAGVTVERVWLQQTPMGDFAVVYLEAKNIATVFERFGASTLAFDVWFRENVLVGIHGMDPSAPPPPLNELILG